jgi:hypothetical protein
MIKHVPNVNVRRNLNPMYIVIGLLGSAAAICAYAVVNWFIGNGLDRILTERLGEETFSPWLQFGIGLAILFVVVAFGIFVVVKVKKYQGGGYYKKPRSFSKKRSFRSKKGSLKINGFVLLGIFLFLLFLIGVPLTLIQENISVSESWKGTDTSSFQHTIPACSYVHEVSYSGSVSAYNRDAISCRRAIAIAGFNNDEISAVCGEDGPEEDYFSRSVITNRILDADYSISAFTKVDVGARTSNLKDNAEASLEVLVDYDLDTDCDSVFDKDDECSEKAGLESNNGCPAVNTESALRTSDNGPSLTLGRRIVLFFEWLFGDRP